MKKLIIATWCFLLLGLCACEMVEPPEETVTTTTTQRLETEKTTSDSSTENDTKAEKNKPYDDALKGIIKAHENHPDQTNYVSYAFYDLDSDGTLELLTGLTGWGIIVVYTIENGIAVRQEGFFVDPVGASPPLLFKNGTIKMGEHQYYRLKDGEIKNTAVVKEDGKYYSFTIGGPITPITKAEYKRVQKEMEGDGQIVELEWKPLAEYGR